MNIAVQDWQNHELTPIAQEHWIVSIPVQRTLLPLRDGGTVEVDAYKEDGSVWLFTIDASESRALAKMTPDEAREVASALLAAVCAVESRKTCDCTRCELDDKCK